MEYLGKVADGLIVFPYGLHGNVPADALALMFAVQGNPDNRAAIAWTPKNRPKLADGEVAFYHPLLPNLIIKLQANGKMLVKSGVSVDVDAPEATFSGNVTIAGNLTVAGTSTFNGTMTNNGKDVGDTHGHAQANDSAGDVQAAISGVT
jgi:phage baseplate assembly protein gpV